jgi:hypothetical protein
MRIILLATVLVAGFHGTASAEPPSSAPLSITVRPSRVDDGTDEAREREDRLYRRMQQNDFDFRHICTGCGEAAPAGGGAPFNPIEALASRPAPSRTQLKRTIEAP